MARQVNGHIQEAAQRAAIQRSAERDISRDPSGSGARRAKDAGTATPAREQALAAILDAVERTVPADFASIDDARASLIAAAAIDTPGGREWCWNAPRIRALLDRPRAAPLVVAGISSNQHQFADGFDELLLLTVPLAELDRRLHPRTGNPFGKDPADRARVLANAERLDALILGAGASTIDVTQRPDVVAVTIAAIAGDSRSRQG